MFRLLRLPLLSNLRQSTAVMLFFRLSLLACQVMSAKPAFFDPISTNITFLQLLSMTPTAHCEGGIVGTTERERDTEQR